MTDSLREPLREQVARRLQQIEARHQPPTLREALYGTELYDAIPWERVHLVREKLEQADEVIRIAEWARQKGREDSLVTWKMTQREIDEHQPPLTLPPEGWTP